MRRAPTTLVMFLWLLSTPLLAATTDESVDQPVSCASGIPGGVNCVPSKADLKEAHKAFGRGLKLENNRAFEQAYEQFEAATRLAPQSVQFRSARELLKSQLVFDHTERGNALLTNGQRALAAAEFRTALKLDPENEFARQRLQDALSVPASPLQAERPALVDSEEIHLLPKQEHATFHYRGDVRGLYTELGSAFGVNPEFDDSVSAKPVRFFVEDVDFFTALKLAGQVSKTMWTALSTSQMLIAADNAENHRQFDRMSLGTFRVPSSVSTPQEANEMVQALRNVCDFQKVTSGQSGTFEVRAPQPMLAACTQLLGELTSERPQVMLDVQVFNVSHNLSKNFGVHLPNTFNLFNIPVAALAALGGQNIQSLINQLISSGGINQAGSSSISQLLAQLQGQQNSIFSQPLATFGGGLTFSGLSLDQLAAVLSLNESWSRSLEHLTLRASQGNDATLHIGTRYPILNASYAPIFNSSAISQVLGNQSYIPPVPSVSYEDLGLNVKAKPAVNGDGDVSLTIELQVRSLTGQSANGVPVISNQEFKAGIRLGDGESAVVAGEISTNDVRSMSGIPGLGQVPLLNRAMVNNTRTEDDEELLIVITPHVLINPDRNGGEIWVSEK